MRLSTPLIVMLGLFYLLASAQAQSLRTFADAKAAAKNGDYKKAYDILLPLATNGNTEAQFNLGVMYLDGYGVNKSCAKAIEWFERSGEGGYIEAQMNLGVMHETAHCTKKDYERSAHWYRLAAELGHAPAQKQLADAYLFGNGLTRDSFAARKWYLLAAEQGDGASLFNLGVMYYEGKEVKQSDVKAFVYITRAARTGHQQARNIIKRLRTQMSASDIALAEQQLRSD